MSKSGDSSSAGRRIGSATSKTRGVIVDSAEQLIAEQGHASITYRSVATHAGVTAGLVQYYFPTLEDLFVAVLQRGTERTLAMIDRAAQSEQPLRALWRYASDATGASMIVEFMAAANHRKEIWDQIGEGGEQVRQAWLTALADRWEGYGISEADLPPAALVFVLTAVGRMARLEDTFGSHTGHEEAIAIIERFLDGVEPRDADGDERRRRRG